MRAVLDTSPLQAFWRAGILDALRQLFESVHVPKAVAEETRWSRELVGLARVPDLAAHPWIRVDPVLPGAAQSAIALLFASHEKRARGRRARRLRPGIEVASGRIVASAGGLRLSLNIPDLEAILLASEIGAIAIVDDRRAIRSATDLGVRTATTREVVEVMTSRGLVPDARGAVERMRQAGYHPTIRLADAWDGTP
jgi:predicted nucleic acid-binding protein